MDEIRRHFDQRRKRLAKIKERLACLSGMTKTKKIRTYEIKINNRAEALKGKVKA